MRRFLLLTALFFPTFAGAQTLQFESGVALTKSKVDLTYGAVTGESRFFAPGFFAQISYAFPVSEGIAIDVGIRRLHYMVTFNKSMTLGEKIFYRQSFWELPVVLNGTLISSRHALMNFWGGLNLMRKADKEISASADTQTRYTGRTTPLGYEAGVSGGYQFNNNAISLNFRYIKPVNVGSYLVLTSRVNYSDGSHSTLKAFSRMGTTTMTLSYRRFF